MSESQSVAELTSSLYEPSRTAVLLYLFGLSIILILVSRLPIEDLIATINAIGPRVVLLALIPVTWLVPDAITLKILLKHKINMKQALYAQLSGDTLNNIIPLVNIGGEPYRIKYLSRYAPLDEAANAILQCRLINALSGVLLTAIVLIASLCLVDLSHVKGLATAMGIIAGCMLLLMGLLLRLVMSRTPSRLVGHLLSRFQLIRELHDHHLSWPVFFSAMKWKMVGRIGKFSELYLIFFILDIIPGFADVILIEAMLMASVSLFFFIPQGMGVNEAGILAAFELLGYATSTGLMYGLLRRARMITYTLLGFCVYLAGSVYDKITIDRTVYKPALIPGIGMITEKHPFSFGTSQKTGIRPDANK